MAEDEMRDGEPVQPGKPSRPVEPPTADAGAQKPLEETAEHPALDETAEHPALDETAQHAVAAGAPAETETAAPRWSARAQVPVRGGDDEELPTSEWSGGPPRSVMLPVLITLAVLILLSLIGLGIWLIVRDRDGGPATPSPTGPSLAPTSVTPTTRRPTPPATTAPVTTAPALVAIPTLRGRDGDAAATLLTGLGFFVEKRQQADATMEAGKVIGTEPAAGAEVLPGSKVIVVVSTGAPLPPSPTAPPTTSPTSPS